MKLPLNCEAEYLPNFLDQDEVEELYTELIDQYQLEKEQLIINAGGKLTATDCFKILFLTKELKEKNSHPEEIHGKSYVWSGAMSKLRNKVESFLNKKFELAMCLYYPNGNYFAAYHYDQETSGVNTILPSISLGEVRTFSFKNRNTDEEEYSLDLKSGSLLVMGAYCQSRYMHSLLKDPKYKNSRINITFREASFK